ncbi:putative E3 ubiquitin-protein ligase TRIML1 [Sarcophilus harrisii]
MLQPHLLQKEVGLSTCDQHGEQEMLFCEEDQRPLCDSCLSAPEHKDHQVLPLETAADKCKKKLHQIWRILQKKEEKFQTALDVLRRRQAQFREQTYALKQSAISEYGKIHQFLWDEEYQCLESLGQQSRDNVVNLEEKEHELTQQIQNVQQMVFQVEEKLDMMPLEMIQAVPDTLKKKEELVFQRPALPCISWPTCPVTGMREMLRSFHRDITFDPESAHPHLILSEDLKKIQYDSICQDLPDNKERFKSGLVVLGAQKFTSGKHYWEVECREGLLQGSEGVTDTSACTKSRETLIRQGHWLLCRNLQTLCTIDKMLQPHKEVALQTFNQHGEQEMFFSH